MLCPPALESSPSCVVTGKSRTTGRCQKEELLGCVERVRVLWGWKTVASVCPMSGYTTSMPLTQVVSVHETVSESRKEHI